MHHAGAQPCANWTHSPTSRREPNRTCRHLRAATPGPGRATREAFRRQQSPAVRCERGIADEGDFARGGAERSGPRATPLPATRWRGFPGARRRLRSSHEAARRRRTLSSRAVGRRRRVRVSLVPRTQAPLSPNRTTPVLRFAGCRAEGLRLFSSVAYAAIDV